MNIVGFRPCSLASVEGKVLLMQLMVLLPRRRRICGKFFTLCTFFYIKGAFDSAWHPGILKKLKAKSCPDGLLNLIYSYFSDRVVTYKGEYSCILERSCPQGGILSPLLWLANINDLLEINIPNVKIQAYADDVCAIITSSKISTLESLASRVFSYFQIWSVDNKLVFDKSKTETILFSRKHQLPTVKLMYDGIEIPVKNKVKYLGVIFDRKLLWTDHVRHKINSTKQYSARLLTVAKSTWNLNPNALRMLYKSVIESHILYACPIWISALRKKNIHTMLRSAQKSSMIIISKSFNTAHVVTALAGVLPMDLRALELRPNVFTENETLAKYAIMDGAPVGGESIPIRVCLSGYGLTPTMRDIATGN
ncbi:hypothetical protein QYM36_001700, partial [Artemia franciscana]